MEQCSIRCHTFNQGWVKCEQGGHCVASMRVMISVPSPPVHLSWWIGRSAETLGALWSCASTISHMTTPHGCNLFTRYVINVQTEVLLFTFLSWLEGGSGGSLNVVYQQLCPSSKTRFSPRFEGWWIHFFVVNIFYCMSLVTFFRVNEKSICQLGLQMYLYIRTGCCRTM